METYLKILIPTIVAFLGSSVGFWAYMLKRARGQDATQQLLMGLVQNKIAELGLTYIERGYITNDEFDDLVNYFYQPYSALGGNGTAERIMHAVERLPFHPEKSPLAQIAEGTHIRATDPTSHDDESRHD